MHPVRSLLVAVGRDLIIRVDRRIRRRCAAAFVQREENHQLMVRYRWGGTVGLLSCHVPLSPYFVGDYRCCDGYIQRFDIAGHWDRQRNVNFLLEFGSKA